MFNLEKFQKAKELNFSNNSKIEELGLIISRECTQKCSFCPHSLDSYKELKFKKFMDIEIIEKVLNDLEYEVNFDIACFGEPLLHKDIFKILKLLEGFKVKLTTNGLMFYNKDFLKKYLKFNIETYISIYNINDLKFFKTLPFILKEMYNFETLSDKKLNNRSGILDFENLNNSNNLNISNTSLKKNSNISLNEMLNVSKSCNYPFYSLYIDTNGDAQYCPNNWTKDLVIGNVLNENLNDIWNKSTNLRIKMLENKRFELPICSKCNVNGTLIGNSKIQYF